MVHDPRMGGMARAERLFGLLEAIHPANKIIFELYSPAGDPFFDLVRRSLPAWSVEMTLEAPDEAQRRRNGKFACSNELVEATIASALAHGCRRVDVFFMVGLPHQTHADALCIAGYCEHLLQRFGAEGRLRPYVAPLAPFLDPGSRAFEHPDLGVSLFCRTLEDHRCWGRWRRAWRSKSAARSPGWRAVTTAPSSRARASHFDLRIHNAASVAVGKDDDGVQVERTAATVPRRVAVCCQSRRLAPVGVMPPLRLAPPNPETPEHRDGT